jgi:hypothetical protein
MEKQQQANNEMTRKSNNQFRTNLPFRHADNHALVTEFGKKPPRSILAEVQKQYELIAKDKFYLRQKRFGVDDDVHAPYQPLAPVGTRDGPEKCGTGS